MKRADTDTAPSQLSSAGATGLAVLSDLALVSGAAGLTLLLAMGGTEGNAAAIRVPLGFLFVFFLPGYAVVSALFPRASPSATVVDGRPKRGVSVSERLVLSVGLSIALVPLVALGLIFVSQPIESETVLSSIAALTCGGAVIAAIRRYRQAPPERFHVPFRAATRYGVSYTTANRLNAVFVLLVALVVTGAGLAIASPGEAEQYTEFGLLNDDDSGELTASEYPTELSTNGSETLYLTVGNYEGRAVTYTTVVQLQRYDSGEITERVELDRRQLTLAHGEETIEEHEVRPTLAGEQVRLTYLLYTGPVPPTPTRANAHRSVSLTVDVTD